jgi:hypothetical protein
MNLPCLSVTIFCSPSKTVIFPSGQDELAFPCVKIDRWNGGRCG